jgi:hypothetical protein
MDYKKEQEEFLREKVLPVGSKVRVVRPCKDYERGWNNTWTTRLDDTIGLVGAIVSVEGSKGINIEFAEEEEIDSDFFFPWFVLEPVSELAKETKQVEGTLTGKAMTEREKYIEEQGRFLLGNGLTIGSRVRVSRASDNYERGWNNSWEPVMNANVGLVGKITEINGFWGIRIEFSGETVWDQYNYPWFVLEPVSEPTVGDKPAEEIPDGGTKHDTNKARYDLIPPEALDGLARLYALGAVKYGDRNWEKGFKWSRLFAALQRHSWAWFGGEDFDPQDRQHHLLSVIWCAVALYTHYARNLGEDDRPEGTVQRVVWNLIALEENHERG